MLAAADACGGSSTCHSLQVDDRSCVVKGNGTALVGGGAMVRSRRRPCTPSDHCMGNCSLA